MCPASFALDSPFFRSLFSPNIQPCNIIVGFTGCGKRHPESQEVSGHDFSHAVNAAK
jgi:hypothetical protein